MKRSMSTLQPWLFSRCSQRYRASTLMGEKPGRGLVSQAVFAASRGLPQGPAGKAKRPAR